MFGPYVRGKAGVYDFKLNYEVLSAPGVIAGQFDVSSGYGGRVMGSAALRAGQNSVTIENVAFDGTETGVEHRVSVEEGVHIKIVSVEIYLKPQ